MFEKKVIDEIEDIFVTELGEGSIFILEQNLRELGLSRETFNRTEIDGFVSHLLKDYEKVIGNHAKFIEKEINNRFSD